LRRYDEASGWYRSSLDVVLSSDDRSEKANDERFESGCVGERWGTMSRKVKSSKVKFAKGVVGGE
jgi:hypothetical protein